MSRTEISTIASARALLASGEGRARRLAARISLSEIAAALGVRPETVWRWESGRRRPAAENALAYALLIEGAMAAVARPVARERVSSPVTEPAGLVLTRPHPATPPAPALTAPTTHGGFLPDGCPGPPASEASALGRTVPMRLLDVDESEGSRCVRGCGRTREHDDPERRCWTCRAVDLAAAGPGPRAAGMTRAEHSRAEQQADEAWAASAPELTEP